MFRRLYLAATLLVAAGVGIYAWRELGHVTASAVFLVIITVTLAWVAWVLFRAAFALVKEPAATEAARATGRRKKGLEREKAALLKALKELEFDHEMGKISDADFRDIGAQYRARATRVLRQLDSSSGVVDYRDLVERDVKSRVKNRATSGETSVARAGAAPAKDAALASELATARPRCAKCATENDPDAEFCKRCGRALAAGSEAAES